MLEREKRIEEYKQSGYYYIPTGVYDLLWSDTVGEWRMCTSAKGMRSCLELDKADRELDEFGYEIILGEFCLDPDKYELEQIRCIHPLALEKSRII